MGLWTDGDAGPNGFPDVESYTWLHRSRWATYAAVFAPNRVQKRTNDKGTYIHTQREGRMEIKLTTGELE